MFKKSRILLGGLVATALVAPLAAGPASAADGDQFLTNGGLPAVGGVLVDVGANTDFALARVLDHPANYGDQNTGSMYDPGFYTVGLNPANLHEFWSDWSSNTNPTLFVNGFTSPEPQKVWQKAVTVEPCTTPGSSVTYTFTANAANLVRPDVVSEFENGAVISVKINGTTLGQPVELGGHSSTDTIEITGAVPVNGNTLDIAIYNGSDVYSGNDFGISNLGLVQVGDCMPPTRVGGLTIGYYKNHTVTEAQWDAAREAYPTIFAGLNDWPQALSVLNTATSKDQGDSMLKAQAIAFALNIQTINGFGAQYVTQTQTATQFLAWVNTNYGDTDLNEKAEKVAAKTVMDLANQDA